MELRLFIKQAIIDIVGGVTDAQDALPDGRVVPTVSQDYRSVETGISHIQGVDFEVVVRAEQTKGSEAKLNVFTAVIGGGVKGQSGEQTGHSATLRFKVPISFPRRDEKTG
jgi:hypothetical protein